MVYAGRSGRHQRKRGHEAARTTATLKRPLLRVREGTPRDPRLVVAVIQTVALPHGAAFFPPSSATADRIEAVTSAAGRSATMFHTTPKRL